MLLLEKISICSLSGTKEMVVYLTKGADARRILTAGFFHAGGESGYTSAFKRRPRPEQCYNCQEIGHKAFKCANRQRCARCAKEGHRHDSCAEEVMKCVPGVDPNESYSGNCPKLYPAQSKYEITPPRLVTN